jgi:hypothetical protein
VVASVIRRIRSGADTSAGMVRRHRSWDQGKRVDKIRARLFAVYRLIFRSNAAMDFFAVPTMTFRRVARSRLPVSNRIERPAARRVPAGHRAADCCGARKYGYGYSATDAEAASLTVAR